MILWPGDLDFWEQRQEDERRRLEEARRRARLAAEWRRLLQQHSRPQRERPRRDDHGEEAHWAGGASRPRMDSSSAFGVVVDDKITERADSRRSESMHSRRSWSICSLASFARSDLAGLYPPLSLRTLVAPQMREP